MYQLITDYIVDLKKIHEKDCNAVVLQRNFPSLKSIEIDLNRLPDEFWLKNQSIYFTTNSANDVYKTLSKAYQTDMLQRTQAELLTDITDIFAHFKDLFKCEQINFRAEKVIANSCKLFHTDSIHARAFVTYYGHGTEFINEANINPLGKYPWDGKCSHEEKNNQLLLDRRKIIRVFPGDLILMKGNKWKDKSNVFSPIYHKSPEISDDNPCRFIVSMDF